jgi:hypothetical protein
MKIVDVFIFDRAETNSKIEDSFIDSAQDFVEIMLLMGKI